MARKRGPRKPAPSKPAAPPTRTLGRRLVSSIQRLPWAWALGLAALHLLFAWLSFVPTPFTGGDNASYLALARSLLERHQYLELYDPATPPHTQYPPGFPLLLAAALALGLKPWVQLKAIIAVCAAVGVAFTFLWIRRRRRPLLALGIGLVLALGPGLLELGHWVLSDVPFWALTAFSLWAWERLGRRGRARTALAIAGTTLAYFTRSAGLPLVLAAFAWLVLKRRWRQLGALAGVLLPLAFLWWLRARSQGGVDYVSQFWFVDPYDPSQGRVDVAGLFARGADNATKYVRIHLPILLTGAANAAGVALSIAVLGLGVFGWVKRLRRPGVAELFLPLYLGLLCAWPAVWSGERFLLPAFPLILLYAGDGVARLSRLAMPRLALPVTAAAAGLVVLLALPGVREQVRTGTTCGALYRMGDPFPCLSPDWRDYFDSAVWSGTALREDAVFITRKPRLWWSLSGRPALIYPFTENHDSVFAVARAANARYVVIDRLGGTSQAYLVPAVLGRVTGFCLLEATQGGTAILGLREGADTLPETEPPTAGADFPICPDEFWRTPTEREAAMRRLGITR